MNWREKQLRFSIRKLKVAVASTVVGISGLSALPQEVLAQTPGQEQATVTYQYVLESELTAAEQALIQKGLPQLGSESGTYFMIYRSSQNLPATGMSSSQALALAGGGLLLLGLTLTRTRKKHLLASIVVVTAAGTFSVSALEGVALSGYNTSHSLAPGQLVPSGVISIPNHEFVGYIVQPSALNQVSHDNQQEPNHQSATALEQASDLLELGSRVSDNISSLTQPILDHVVSGLEVFQPLVPSPVAEASRSDLEAVEPVVDSPAPFPEASSLVVAVSEPTLETVAPVVDSAISVDEVVEPVVNSVPSLEVSSPVVATPEPPLEAVAPVVDVSTPVAVDSVDSVVVAADSSLDQPSPVVDSSISVDEVVEPVVIPVQPSPAVVTEELVSLPFGTTYVEDPTSPLGSEVLIQAGVAGQKRLRYTDGVLTSEEILSPAQDQVISRGSYVAPVVPVEPVFEQPALIEQPLVSEPVVEGEVIVPEVSPVIEEPVLVEQPVADVPSADVSLEQPLVSEPVVEGEVFVPQVPPVVSEPVLAEQPVVDLPVATVPIEEPVFSDPVVVAPVAPPVVETYEEESVAFEVETVQDPALPLGTTVYERSGAAGTRRNKYVNGQLVASELVLAPVNQLVRVGSQPVPEPAQPLIQEEEVAFATQVMEDDQLYSGQEEVVQAGQVGRRELTILDGEVKAERLLLAPVDQIIRRGTKPLEGSQSQVRIEEVPFETQSNPDSELWDGERVVVRPGKPGMEQVTEVYKTWKGDLTDELLTTSRQTLLPALTQLERLGTKSWEGTATETELVPVAFDTQIIEDHNQYLGFEAVQVVGQEGQKRLVRTYKTIKGVRQDQLTLIEELIRPAITRVLVKGTKPLEGTLELIRLEDLPFERETRQNPELWEDSQARVLTAGKPGQLEVRTLYRTMAGQTTEQVLSETSRVLSQPITQIEEIGTKPLAGTLTETEERELAFGIDYEDDPNLLVGSQEESRPGQAGRERISRTYQTLRGEKVGSPEEKIDLLEPAQNQIIRRGTKPLPEADKQEPLLASSRQVVEQGQEASAAASLEVTGLTNVDQITWKVAPDTSLPGQGLPGLALVTYTDGSADEVPVVIDVTKVRTKPLLTLSQLLEQEDERRAVLDYRLDDPTQSYRGALLELYDGETLVRQLALTSLDALALADLDWYKDYTLKTTLKYDLGQGEQTETLPDHRFSLDYKRLEIKHVDAAELYLKQADNRYQKVEHLTGISNHLSDYYVKLVSNDQKDVYLSVTAITQETLEGRPAYKVTATAPQLIQYDAEQDQNKANYSFYVPKFQPSGNGKYRTFADLIEGMRANPAATFEVDSDLSAEGFVLDAGATSYVPGAFTGQLLGGNHAIKGLTAPLFDHLRDGFVVRDLDLKDVAIKTTQAEVGALAKQTTGIAGTSLIANVAVQGSITADRSVGGLVYRTRNTQMEQVAFEGTISTTNKSATNFTGGLVGYLDSGSNLMGGKVDVAINLAASQTSRVGSVIGAADVRSGQGGDLSHLHAQGLVINTVPATGAIGGLIGTVNPNIRLSHAVSEVDVANGQSLIGGVIPADVVDKASVTVVDLARGTTDTATIYRSQEEVDAQVASLNLTVTLDDTVRVPNHYDVDYSRVAAYRAENTIKYANTEKLLPFYNKEFIVKQGNLLTSGKLSSHRIQSLVPMAGDKIVSDYSGQKAAINRLMVHYTDGSIDYLDLTYQEDFKDTGLAEYRIADTQLLYTPNQLTSNYQDVVAKVLPELSSLDYYSPDLLTKLGKALGADTVETHMDKLYLRESFDTVKANLADILPAVLSTSSIIATPNHDLAQYILDNKEELVLSLAYLNRWYDLDFAGFKAKDLILYHQDFFGKPVDSLAWLIGLGKGGYDNLRANNNLSTYVRDFAEHTGQASLFDYLGALRQRFTTYETDSEWFKATTKAYLVETPSKERPDVDVSAYNRMVKTRSEQNGVLPLLTAQEGIYLISNMTSLTYGMFDRYFDMGLKDSNPEAYAQQVARVQEMVDQAALKQAAYFDTWYRINPGGKQEELIRVLPAWDAYTNSRGTYLKRWGTKDVNQAVQDFFGPILPDINGAAQRRGYHEFDPIGSGAIAWGNVTYLLLGKALENEGLSLFTHETIHNLDGNFFLGGHGRRTGVGVEFYPMGLLQAPEAAGHSTSVMALNTMFDFTANADAANRYQNLTPERFQSSADIQEYLHGAFDVLYLMDYAEANAILAQPDAIKKAFFHKIENVYRAEGDDPQAYASNKYRPLTDQEAASLKTWEDLVDQSIMGRRETYRGQTEQELQWDSYYRISLFSPIYSALSNDKGAPGDIMFRRMAFELMAAKGYDAGFLPYATNKLADKALAEGSSIYSSWSRKEVGLPTDKMAFDAIFQGEYADWAAFKKAMFQERIAKKDQLKPITINLFGANVTIDSFEKLQSLMTASVKYDGERGYAADNRLSRVRALKGLVYNAYLRQSQDFKDSIFN